MGGVMSCLEENHNVTHCNPANALRAPRVPSAHTVCCYKAEHVQTFNPVFLIDNNNYTVQLPWFKLGIWLNELILWPFWYKK